MKQKTSPKVIIDDFIQTYLAPFMKEAGYKKNGRTWLKENGDLTYIINIQADRWNSENRVPQFFINYGVYVPSLVQDLMGIAPPQYPTEGYCAIRSRVRDRGFELFDRRATGR